MVIITKHSNFFGKVTIIENKSSIVSISTAREGIFKGLSTMISIGRYPNLTPFAKIIYESKCSSESRYLSHNAIASFIDIGMKDFNRDLKSTLTAGIDYINSSPLHANIKEIQTQR